MTAAVRTDWKKVGVELAATALHAVRAGYETVKAAWEYARGNYLHSAASGISAVDNVIGGASRAAGLWSNWPRLGPQPVG